MLNKDYILECIKKYCRLEEDLSEGEFYYLVVEPLENAKCFPEGAWTYDSGVTKGVLIFDDLDYVIKIPFYCEWLEGDGYYDSEDNWVCECEEGPSGYPFGGCQVEGYIHDNDWDYCETEQYRYLEAEKANMEEYFAKTWFLASVNDWPIYAQTKACMFRSEDSRTTRSKRNYTDKEHETARAVMDNEHFYVNKEWVMDFIAYYGVDRLVAFIKFCDEQLIDDLHDGNLGYICGIPCLVDYSSFNG